MFPLDITMPQTEVASLEGWSSGQESILGSDRCGAGAPACLRRQACSCPSHSDKLSHAWCQACVELCLLGKEGSRLGWTHRIVHHAMASLVIECAVDPTLSCGLLYLSFGLLI